MGRGITIPEKKKINGAARRCIPSPEIVHSSEIVIKTTMVAASIKPIAVREGSDVKTVPAALSVFRVAEAGTLDFVRTYDVETNGGTHYWMGIIGA